MARNEAEIEPLKVELRVPHTAIVGLATDPDYLHEMIKHPDKEAWVEAINNELTMLEETGMYEILNEGGY